MLKETHLRESGRIGLLLFAVAITPFLPTAHASVISAPSPLSTDVISESLPIAVYSPLSSSADDCNTNGTPDADDITAALCADCNTNGRPDSCDDDCNTNDTADECDVTGGTSFDLDRDCIPDECRPLTHFRDGRDDTGYRDGLLGDIPAGLAGPTSAAPLSASSGGGGGGGSFPAFNSGSSPAFGGRVPVESSQVSPAPNVPSSTPTILERTFSSRPIGSGPIPTFTPTPPPPDEEPPPPPVPEPATTVLLLMTIMARRVWLRRGGSMTNKSIL